MTGGTISTRLLPTALTAAAELFTAYIVVDAPRSMVRLWSPLHGAKPPALATPA